MVLQSPVKDPQAEGSLEADAFGGFLRRSLAELPRVLAFGPWVLGLGG